MITAMKKLILASLLLSAVLLTAGSVYAAPLYFPHVATSLPWQTEIAIINTSPDQTVTGSLRALSNEGQLIETKAVILAAHGRRQSTIADEFTNHTNIGYIIFDTDSDTVQGYTKFYQEGIYRAAIPVVKDVNTSDIHISHIASVAPWWTMVSLVNTTSTTKELTITFNNGQSRQITLTANQHRAFDIAQEFFNNQPQSDIQSAVITNASGVIGLELFGSTGGGNQMDGILLTDKTASTIYYPHVASNDDWWTGIVAYNPSALACTITITPYSAQGTPLTSSTVSIQGKGKYICTVMDLGLPAQTAWFKIDSTRPITGFELFGSSDGNQLAAYAGGGGTGAKTGVFPKIEKNGGWTGIIFVNTEASAASVTLTAYNDNGTSVAIYVLPVGGCAKVVTLPEIIPFAGDINSATYIAYSSDRNIMGFQFNSSSDSMMLDALPGLAAYPEPGSLTLTISPQGVVDAGGQWRRVGTTTWFNSGATEAGIPVGSYTVEFKSVAGWANPSSVSVTISSGVTETGTGIYVQQTTPVIQVTPISLNFGYVPVGSTKDRTLTVKNAGGETLTGNATTSAPFSIVSGGSYTLDSGQSQVVMVRYQPTSQGPHNGTVVFTGGDGATAQVTGKTERPLGLPWLLLLLGN